MHTLVFISWNKSSNSENLQVAVVKNSFITGRNMSPGTVGCTLWNSISRSTSFKLFLSCDMSFSSSAKLTLEAPLT